MRVAICAGGTAGHASLGLAVAERWQARGNASILFLGSQHGFESRMASEAGFRFREVTSAPFVRQNTLAKVRAPHGVWKGFLESRRILREQSIDVALCFGGYASLPCLLAAGNLRIPVVMHEANVQPGLANRLTARMASRICVGFDATREAFPGAAVSFTGNPARSEFTNVLEGPARLDLVRRVVVCGGSGGSEFLNQRCPELFGHLARQGRQLEIVHLCGRFAADPVRRAYARAGVAATVDPFTHQMPAVYRDADLAVCCAGAGTMAELAAMGLPALLVPLRVAAGNHQESNARMFSASTGCPWVSEEGWTLQGVASLVNDHLLNPVARERCRRRLLHAAQLTSADLIIQQCERLLPTIRAAA